MTATYQAYAQRGANAWWRYPLALVLGFVLTVVIGAVVIVVGQALKVVPSDMAKQLQHPDHPQTFFLLTGVMFGVVLAGYALAFRIVHRKRARDLLGAWSWRSFWTGLVIWLGVLVVTALIDFAIAPSGFSISSNRPTAILAVTAVVGLGVQTFAEEFVFRGYLTQGLLLAFKRPAPAAIVSGLLFGALHIPNGAPQAASATVFGIVLALIAIRTGGLAFVWGLHLVNNLFGALVLVSRGDAFRNSPGFFVQDTPQLMWWDALLGGAALIALALVMARVWARRDAVSNA
ncbi:MAG TPA: CPBP family intramembrane glutamic endopeptidase [Phenylobacterium sp.]|nr:CPBP family intramembrane glutamic endopeptidase [Phenylobacterium sp.]